MPVAPLLSFEKISFVCVAYFLLFNAKNMLSFVYQFEGELYLLATDQGYLNQFDLVWEKLNEVNIVFL